MVSAMKQSGRAWLPVLNAMAPFSSFVSSAACLRKYIAWCGTGREQHLADIHDSPAPAIIMIGPEGDFSDHEVGMAKKNGFLPINLGPNRLRTETAGLAACLLLTTINNCPTKHIFRH
jgi:16S rRNA (uracil1498-N3)-methyltransferase